MNFRDFLLFVESAPSEYIVVNNPTHLYFSPNFVSPTLKIAQEAEKKFKEGRMALMPFLKKQLVGFRAKIDGTEYLKSMDGIFIKKNYPISGFKGSAIGQTELYSPYALKKYTTFLKSNPKSDTDPVTVDGTPRNYKVRDGHHRMEAYKRAERTTIPVWIEKKR